MLVILGAAASASGSSGAAEAPRSIRAFDAYCTENLDPFVAVCNKLGGDAATVGNLIREAWMEMRAYLLMASACKEPPQASLGPLLAKLGEKTKAISQTVQRNEWEKHTKTCQEGVQALNWLVVKPAPRDFIESYIGGSDYWANNIRREHRTTNPDQVAFCDNFKKLLQELMVCGHLSLSLCISLHPHTHSHFLGVCERVSYDRCDLEPKRL
jgi:adenylyl cyclase-associated protein